MVRALVCRKMIFSFIATAPPEFIEVFFNKPVYDSSANEASVLTDSSLIGITAGKSLTSKLLAPRGQIPHHGNISVQK